MDTQVEELVTAPDSEIQTTPELSFLADVRNTLLGENPQGQEFDSSLTNKALSAVEDYLSLKSIEGKYPFVKDNYGGKLTANLIHARPDLRHLELKVGNYFVIDVQGNGRVNIRALFMGGNDELIHGIRAVQIDGKTGEINVIRPTESGENQVAQEENVKLNTILDLTREYYEELKTGLLGGEITSAAIPSFPSSEMNKLKNGR